MINKTLATTLNVINGTPKSVAMLTLQDRAVLTSYEMRRRAIVWNGGESNLPRENAFRDYGLETFLPFELATGYKVPKNYFGHTESEENRVDAFQITPDGISIIPAVDLALKWEEQYARKFGTLATILGSSSSQRCSIKGPETRVALMELLSQRSYTQKELAEMLNSSPTRISGIVHALKLQGMIDYTYNTIRPNQMNMIYLTELGREFTRTLIDPIKKVTNQTNPIIDLSQRYDGQPLPHVQSSLRAHHELSPNKRPHDNTDKLNNIYNCIKEKGGIFTGGDLKRIGIKNPAPWIALLRKEDKIKKVGRHFEMIEGSE